MLKFSFPSTFPPPADSMFCGSLFSDTRHLKPVLLIEKIDKLIPYFTNYLLDTTPYIYWIPLSAHPY
jgi:hypothetical protein